MASDSDHGAVLNVLPLHGNTWSVRDPFLFCVHHVDNYPAGDDRLGVKDQAELDDRDIGQDFSGKDGWSMYHGNHVPGFPQHPHRGFETITVARKGFIDHSDSLGALARFGEGDVQWLTAGSGISHSEMFPLLNMGGRNPQELFQIWLNLPAKNKMVAPYFSMHWAERIPRKTFTDDQGKHTHVTVVAGKLDDLTPVAPPPDSWAAVSAADLAVWTITMDDRASWRLPAAWGGDAAHRTLFFYQGAGLQIDQRDVPASSYVWLRAGRAVQLVADKGPVELLLLQGTPIGEPVAKQGPFVMNTHQELRQAFADYQRTRFGGWPHDAPAPVFPRDKGRFAKHVDGRVEKP